MPNYHYTARSQNGTLVRGQLEGKSERSVKSKIVRMGYYPVAIKATPGSSSSLVSSAKGRVKHDDLVTFTWQLSALMGASIPIVDSLFSLEEETESPVLKSIISSVRKDIQDGEPFSKGLSRFPRVFNSLFISLIRAGEIGGILDTVLRRLAEHLDHEHEMRQRIRSSLVYPAVVACLAVIAVVVMLLTVVPVFSKIYKSLHVELPFQTRVLIAMSNFLIHVWWAIPILIAAGVLIFFKIRELPGFEPYIDKIKLDLPIFGKLNRKVAVSRFVRTMSYLVSSGIPMMESLELAGSVTGNVIIKDAISRIRQGVGEGEGLAKPIRRSHEFPTLVANMVSAGEESGNLDTMLEKIADFYDREVEVAIKQALSIMEPLLTVAMGIVVGFIAISMYMPIFNIAKAIHH